MTFAHVHIALMMLKRCIVQPSTFSDGASLNYQEAGVAPVGEEDSIVKVTAMCEADTCFKTKRQLRGRGDHV